MWQGCPCHIGGTACSRATRGGVTGPRPAVAAAPAPAGPGPSSSRACAGGPARARTRGPAARSSTGSSPGRGGGGSRRGRSTGGRGGWAPSCWPRPPAWPPPTRPAPTAPAGASSRPSTRAGTTRPPCHRACTPRRRRGATCPPPSAPRHFSADAARNARQGDPHAAGAGRRPQPEARGVRLEGHHLRAHVVRERALQGHRSRLPGRDSASVW